MDDFISLLQDNHVDIVVDVRRYPGYLDIVSYSASNCSAISNICTHMGGPLADGTLEGYEVECPWHGSKFDIRTGKVTRPPAKTPEQTYEVKVVDGNDILIRKK